MPICHDFPQLIKDPGPRPIVMALWITILTHHSHHSHTILTLHSHTILTLHSHHSHTSLTHHSHTPLTHHSHTPLTHHSHTPLTHHSHTPLTLHSHTILTLHSHTILKVGFALCSTHGGMITGGLIRKRVLLMTSPPRRVHKKLK